MKLSEKLIELRKAAKMTQEELADICGVSRQSISKWEADIALPELDKLLILGQTFNCPIDILVKDELSLNSIKETHLCGNNAVTEKKNELYEGILIKESIDDDSILDFITVHKIELWHAGGKPKYWTALFFTSSKRDFPSLISKVMIADADKGGNWFVDFKAANEKYIVFRNKILKYHIGNQAEKDYVCHECRKQGITDAEMNWAE